MHNVPEDSVWKTAHKEKAFQQHGQKPEYLFPLHGLASKRALAVPVLLMSGYRPKDNLQKRYTALDKKHFPQSGQVVHIHVALYSNVFLFRGNTDPRKTYCMYVCIHKDTRTKS